MTLSHPLAEDLNAVLERTEPLWAQFRGSRLFITGGTGFFGRWLLESFCWANERLKLGANAVVLSRDPGAFSQKAPELAASAALHFVHGDVRAFEFPPGEFNYIIHAAADFNPELQANNPALLQDTIVEGTRHVLNFAETRKVQSLLFVSSGAIYGRQPADLPALSETSPAAPDTVSPTTYGRAKHSAEHLCAQHAQRSGLPIKIARAFAFVGPYLPRFYAIADFISDARSGGPIRVRSDGAAVRSYLYAADLATWLWHIFVRGQPGRPYNVGSDQAVTIKETAETVAASFSPAPRVIIEGLPAGGLSGDRYVPDIGRARTELQLSVWTGLKEAILKTVASDQ